jgi:hypothetical protein
MAENLAKLVIAALTVASWLTVAIVVISLPVTPSSQAVFYSAGFVALTGSAALALSLYYARLGRRDAPVGIVGRLGTGMRFAFACEFALWLQSLRMLTAAYAVLLIAGFLCLEALVRHGSPRGDRPRD